MNVCLFTGNITKDPEVVRNGDKVKASFTLAVQSSRKDEKGEYVTDFITMKAFKNNAEFLAKYVKKGNKLAITGTYVTYQYEKNGTMIYGSEIWCERIENLSPKAEVKPTQEAQKEQAPVKNVNVSDDDLPF